MAGEFANPASNNIDNAINSALDLFISIMRLPPRKLSPDKYLDPFHNLSFPFCPLKEKEFGETTKSFGKNTTAHQPELPDDYG